nr:uncharacterized protein LOC120969636 [Aegilops tauschii subsp. strangulata]
MASSQGKWMASSVTEENIKELREARRSTTNEDASPGAIPGAGKEGQEEEEREGASDEVSGEADAQSSQEGDDDDDEEEEEEELPRKRKKRAAYEDLEAEASKRDKITLSDDSELDAEAIPKHHHRAKPHPDSPAHDFPQPSSSSGDLPSEMMENSAAAIETLRGELAQAKEQARVSKAAADKAATDLTAEQAVRHRFEERVTEVEQKLKDIARKCESLEEENKAEGIKLAKALQDAKEARSESRAAREEIRQARQIAAESTIVTKAILPARGLRLREKALYRFLSEVVVYKNPLYFPAVRLRRFRLSEKGSLKGMDFDYLYKTGLGEGPSEEKWKFGKARTVKKAQYKKECFLKQNVLKLSPDELVALQSEIKKLGDEFDAYRAEWLGAKVRFVRMTKGFTSNVAAPTHIEIPHAEASTQPTEEHANTADDDQVADENESTRVDEAIPAADEIARATTSVAPEDQAKPAEASAAVPEDTEQARATASVAPEQTAPISSAPPAPTPSPILPSASEAKTKAAERAAVKKRKASATSESSVPKKMKTLTSSYDNTIDVVPVSSMPSKEIVPFGEDYQIPSGSDEEAPSTASLE